MLSSYFNELVQRPTSHLKKSWISKDYAMLQNHLNRPFLSTLPPQTLKSDGSCKHFVLSTLLDKPPKSDGFCGRFFLNSPYPKSTQFCGRFLFAHPYPQTPKGAELWRQLLLSAPQHVFHTCKGKKVRSAPKLSALHLHLEENVSK